MTFENGNSLLTSQEVFRLFKFLIMSLNGPFFSLVFTNQIVTFHDLVKYSIYDVSVFS